MKHQGNAMTIKSANHSSPGLLAANRPRTAFVLSGGASLCAMQVGMLQALYESGVVPDLLVGTSGGALNAAFVASRPQSEATARELGRVWRELTRDDVFPVNMGALVGGMSGRRDHVVSDRGLRRLTRTYTQFDDLSEAAIPLHLVAFDLHEEREVLLSAGPAIDAVVASSSIPGVFPPVVIGERPLIDGGVVNNTPISHAIELGAQRIYVLPTQDPGCVPRLANKRALDIAIHGVSLLVNRRLEADLTRYSGDAELIVLPAPNRTGVQPTNFDHTSRLIGEALNDARAFLTGDDVCSHPRPFRDRIAA
jgi:NTE family protein